ncbi:MAG: hypothetical protein M1823_008142, partial [Watsoniomyces obsoletus]
RRGEEQQLGVFVVRESALRDVVGGPERRDDDDPRTLTNERAEGLWEAEVPADQKTYWAERGFYDGMRG